MKNSDEMTECERKITALIGLSKKAGKLIRGSSMLVGDIKSKKKTQLIIIASDASENSQKKVIDAANFRAVPYVKIFLTKDQLGKICGGNFETAAVGITDEKFASAINSHINN